jgi:hypothetical protein
MRRSLISLFIVVAILIWGSASLTLQASPLPQVTPTIQPGWSIGALVRVKASVPFSWLRSTPATSGRVVATAQRGEFLVLNGTTPVWDGVQWWWPVRWGNISGFVEQESLELVIAAPTAGAGTTQPTTAPTTVPTSAVPATAVPAGSKAVWPATTTIRVKTSVPFVLLRATASSNATPVDHSPAGDQLMVISSIPISDGVQWWWQVRRVKGNVVGWAEQQSLEPVAVVPGTPIPATQASTPMATQVATQVGTPSATSAAPATSAGFALGSLRSVKDSLPYAWVRSEPSTKGSVVSTLYRGWLVIIRDATPTWDGVQWWWKVYVPAFNAQGWIEQNSLF